MNPHASLFVAKAMEARRKAYFDFILKKRKSWFAADGSYLPGVENDRRISFWILPALLSTDDPEGRAWACRFIMGETECWNDYNIFVSSSVASNLVHCRKQMTPDLIRRSEEHLDRFTIVEGGRKPCAGANDYNFHGWNDNMPAMATRQLVFAGDLLGRKDFTDYGLLRLEMLCTHLQRRGLISEHTSGTYLPITITAIMDIAENSLNREAGEMALACSNRMLLDLIGHCHESSGAIGGVQCRAYMTDHTSTLSNYNALMWYLSGSPLLINPVDALSLPESFNGHIHHGGNVAFNAAQFVEVLMPSYSLVDRRIVEFAQKERPEEYEIRATADYARSNPVITTAHHRKPWCLASSLGGCTWSGHKTSLQGALVHTPEAKSHEDRIAFWAALNCDGPDYGDMVPRYDGGLAPADNVNNSGEFHCLQRRGTALALGRLNPGVIGKKLSRMAFSMVFSTWSGSPDEVFEGKSKLSAWEGDASPDAWQFLRYGEVYVGMRMAGAAGAQSPVSLKRIVRNGYLRFELGLLEGEEKLVDADLQASTDFACVFEISDRSECGSFESFRTECLKGVWEFYRWSDRYSRYSGRNGELFIGDSNDGSLRFAAINGESVREPALIEATGLDPELLKLFPDGRKIRLRRLLHDYSFAGSPFSDNMKRTGRTFCHSPYSS